jgi:hypothetical protein
MTTFHELGAEFQITAVINKGINFQASRAEKEYKTELQAVKS